MNFSESDDRSTATSESRITDYVNGIDLEKLAVVQMPTGWYVIATADCDSQTPDWTNAKFCGRPFHTCMEVERSPTRGFGNSLDWKCAYCMCFQNTFTPVLFSYGLPGVAHNVLHWGGKSCHEHHGYLIGPIVEDKSSDMMRLAKKHYPHPELRENINYHYQPAGIEFWSDEDEDEEQPVTIVSGSVTP